MSIVQAHLGQPAPIKGMNISSIWDALTHLGKAIQDVEEVNEMLDDILDIKIADAVTKHPDFQQLVNEVIQQRTTETDISACLVEIECLLTTHHERLRNIRQVIQGTPNHASALGASQLSSIEARLVLVEQTISNGPTPPRIPRSTWTKPWMKPWANLKKKYASSNSGWLVLGSP